jgi:hypothetical protein
MRRRLLGVVLIAAVTAALLAAPAAARAPMLRRGPCSGGPTHWVLAVQKGLVPGTLRTRFVVRAATPGDRWQIALSDGDRRLPTVDRVVNLGGAFRVVGMIHNRPKRDHIIVSATNTFDGSTCTGRITF